MRKISIILPTYNRAHILKKSIDSVLFQTYENIELIIVDDGSTDNTEELLGAYADTRLKVIKTGGRKGACYARNLGIQHVTGNFIAFQDSDDVWLPHKLDTLMNYMNDFNADVCFSSFIRIDEGYHKASIYPPYNIEKPTMIGFDHFANSILRQNLISTQTLLMTKSAMDILHGFDENLQRFQDWELAIRVFSMFQVLWVPEPLVNATVQHDSITKNFKAGIEARTYLYTKHMNLFKRYKQARVHFIKDLIIRAIFSRNISLILKALSLLKI